MNLLLLKRLRAWHIIVDRRTNGCFRSLKLRTLLKPRKRSTIDGTKMFFPNAKGLRKSGRRFTKVQSDEVQFLNGVDFLFLKMGQVKLHIVWNSVCN